MLDLALFAMVMGMFALGLRRPFVWVLAYLYIDILAPQKIGWALTPALPLSQIAFFLAFAGWAITDRKAGIRFTLRQAILAALLVYCWWTMQYADFPEDAAFKWEWVWKALVFAIFLPFTLTTRLRIEAALLVMALTAGAIIIAAGIKTSLGGGGYGNLYLLVNDNSNIYESSTLATVAIAIIPLIVWLAKHGTIYLPDWRVKIFAGALIFACLLIPIGTEARTGLVAIAVLAALMLRDVKKRVFYIAGAVVLGLVALPFVPQSYYERMATITTPAGDESASTRVQVWEWTIDYAAENPFGGGFDAYRGNKFTYQMPVREQQGNTVSVQNEEVTDSARAYHSAVFEMLGEQGYPGLVLWLALHILGLVHMERIRRKWRDRASESERWQGPLASALQYANIIYLVGALFQGIAYQPFVMMLIGLQIALSNHCGRSESARRERLRKAAKDARRAALPSGPTPDPAMP